ncbi:nucleoside-specific channel-forming Tsx family protein [Moritella yayanosii]|uniref:Putative Nucleoside-specific channel-forming protein, Tsx n=1 Tax=Moritella yayanosii TaxID=69539 RepID=A0A330LWT0_9GAMM|nr:outer membrane protein OmpK [Moritella yayanosii]SQD80188.1 putative Nucleoside-specific channel-forming protein, Tsx [Moritella yayanosii]
MKNIRNAALAATTLAVISCNAFAADYSDDIHKNDYKWSQFNLMYAINEKPSGEDNLKHNYLEMEFGGRSGVVDLYGYVDVFNLLGSDSSDSDKKDGASKLYMKLAPRFSLDGMTGQDLSFGPVQEVYIATLFNWGGGAFNKDGTGDVNNAFFGLGSDVMVPWLGKVGMNLYGLYEVNNKDWNGYQFSMNWFKPFVNFDNGSFISYQGYIDYQFGMDTSAGGVSSGGAMFNGIYWHSERYSVGYGLKAYNDIYGIKDSSDFASSGFGHYFAATYKF